MHTHARARAHTCMPACTYAGHAGMQAWVGRRVGPHGGGGAAGGSHRLRKAATCCSTTRSITRCSACAWERKRGWRWVRRARRASCRQWGCRQWGCRQWGSAHAHTHLVLQDRFELHLEDKVQLARARLAAVGEAPARAQVAEQVGVGRDRGHAARRLQCDAARVRLGEGEEAERERRVEASWSVARADARGRAKRKELRVPLHVGHHSIDLLARVGHTLLALQGVQSGREELAVRSSWHASTRVARPPQHAAWEAPPADDCFWEYVRCGQ